MEPPYIQFSLVEGSGLSEVSQDSSNVRVVRGLIEESEESSCTQIKNFKMENFTSSRL